MNPFPGLRPFGEADSEVFFGRDEEIDELLLRLATKRMIAVLGVSGCGKSSLIHAGLIPLLRSGLADPLGGDWQIYKMVPGTSPLELLDQALGTQLERRSHALLAWAAKQAPGKKILIFVDQFEEILAYRKETLEQDGGNKAALFVDLLVTAVTDPAVPLYVVLTMRTDYLGEAAVFRSLAEALNDGHYLVPRLTRLRQQDAIVRPAESQAVKPQPGLVQCLLNDSEGDPDKLPVLQHLLKRLWEDRSDGQLSLSVYHEVGGWEHALERDAENVLSEFAPEEEGVRRMFQWLGELGTGDKPIRRRRPLEELPGVSGLAPERVRAVLQSFCKRDFLRFEDGDSGTVDFVHESVMWQWPKLKRWMTEELAEAARVRFLHEAAIKQLPLTGTTLEEAQAVRARIDSCPKWVTRYIENPAEVQKTLSWIAESEKRQQDELAGLRRRQRLLLCALVAAAFVVLLIAWLGWRAYASKHMAEERLSMNYWSQSRVASERGRETEAVHFAAEAIRQLPSLRENLLLDVRTIWPVFPLKNMVAVDGRVNGALFSHDDSRILTWSGDIRSREGQAQVWDARTGQALGPALQHKGSVYGALFSHDESRILTRSDDGTARLWDARTGQALGPALRHKGRVNGALFSHDESRILTWSSDGTARIWPINIDLDFPTDYLSLWLGAMTGNQFDLNTRKEEPLSPAAWREIRSQYEKVAATHAKECKYPEFNEWLRESH